MSNNLIILSNIDFKNKSGASYARVISYASALASQGTNVIITSKYNKLIRNELNNTGVELVQQLGVPELKKKKKVNDIYLENLFFCSYYKYLKHIYNFSRTIDGNHKFLLYPGNLALDILSLFYIKLMKKEQVFIEKNELMLGIALNYPIDYHPVKFLILILVKLFLLIIGFIQDIITPFFTGIIAISTNIEKLYIKHNSKIMRVPILCERYIKSSNKNLSGNFSIGYTGDINQNKDGIKTFIHMLSELPRDKNINFHIWGSKGSKTQFESLIKTINLLGLSSKILFHGYIKSEQLKNEISGIDLLVLPRPLNLQTKYGFSTKLGEYMMSGIPVLVTDVSDNKLYIIDGVNGFIVKNNSKHILLNKMNEILNMNKANLLAIGEGGEKTAILNFSTSNYAKQLNTFLFN